MVRSGSHWSAKGKHAWSRQRRKNYALSLIPQVLIKIGQVCSKLHPILVHLDSNLAHNYAAVLSMGMTIKKVRLAVCNRQRRGLSDDAL